MTDDPRVEAAAKELAHRIYRAWMTDERWAATWIHDPKREADKRPVAFFWAELAALAAADRVSPDTAAAVAAERERCAKIAERFEDYTGAGSEDENSLIGTFARGNRNARRNIAAAIRKGDGA